MKWGLWECLVWVFFFAWFGYWEFYAGADKMGGADFPMLTQFTVRYIPWFITMPVLSWMWMHFYVRYRNPAYIHWLHTGMK